MVARDTRAPLTGVADRPDEAVKDAADRPRPLVWLALLLGCQLGAVGMFLGQRLGRGGVRAKELRHDPPGLADHAVHPVVPVHALEQVFVEHDVGEVVRR